MSEALAEVEARREARKVAAHKDYEDRLAVDLEAIDAIEAQLGDSNVATVRVVSPDGLPCAAAVRCPKPAEMKRFRDQVKPYKDNRNREITPDPEAAAEMLVAVCLVHPDKDAFARLSAARPGLMGQLAHAAVKLGAGAEEAEGK